MLISRRRCLLDDFHSSFVRNNNGFALSISDAVCAGGQNLAGRPKGILSLASKRHTLMGRLFFTSSDTLKQKQYCNHVSSFQRYSTVFIFIYYPKFLFVMTITKINNHISIIVDRLSSQLGCSSPQFASLSVVLGPLASITRLQGLI